MQAETRVIRTLAILDHHIVADLPTDAIAVVVSSDHPTNLNAVAVLHEDAARVIAIELIVVVAIPIEHEILDADVLHEFTAEDREQGGCGGVVHLPEILAQGLIELEAVACARHQRALN